MRRSPAIVRDERERAFLHPGLSQIVVRPARGDEQRAGAVLDQTERRGPGWPAITDAAITRSMFPGPSMMVNVRVAVRGARRRATLDGGGLLAGAGGGGHVAVQEAAAAGGGADVAAGHVEARYRRGCRPGPRLIADESPSMIRAPITSSLSVCRSALSRTFTVAASAIDIRLRQMQSSRLDLRRSLVGIRGVGV